MCFSGPGLGYQSTEDERHVVHVHLTVIWKPSCRSYKVSGLLEWCRGMVFRLNFGGRLTIWNRTPSA